MPEGQAKPFKTLDAQPTATLMIKPGELIDVVEVSPLTLTDRRIYNLLIANAWEQIERAVTHVIAKKDLRGSREANDRVGENVERLMAAIARLEIERDGKRYIRRVQLLGATDEGREDDALLYYRFPAELRAIIRKSSIFARLRKDVIFHLSSKYSLALYEIVQKRGNHDWKRSEEFTVERFRQMLGVESGKLQSFKNLNAWAIRPAVAEVNLLSDFACSVTPVLVGRKVMKVKLGWAPKNTVELKAAHRELQSAKVGRRARLRGNVEQIVSPADELVPAIPEHFEQAVAAAIVRSEPLTEERYERIREAQRAWEEGGCKGPRPSIFVDD
jgi:Initiator Rep protein, WH2/Initiator Replication protein, WH1